MIKQIVARYFVLDHSKKNHATTFCPALKSVLRWFFVLCLVIGTQAVQAQHWITLKTQDFGSGAVNSTSATPAAVLSPGTTDYTPVTAWGTTPNDSLYAISTKSQNGGTGFNLWINANDHTSGSAGTGRMMVVNANFAKKGPQTGVILDLPLSVRAIPGAIYRINIWAANVFRSGQTIYNNTNGSGTKPGYVGFGVYTGP
jgi:hypothetical protein